ncbi:hypothetical protein M0813_07323 [Anaeramoeba flamelloides]|uniref:Myb-like domain-containing protein n=1 Tax=Anaeramoeba flamelloides TaxID=1746091 RepID=A0ABQ8XBH0_9EUKA|nr:hypothetical protein M0813_07323 [Anaeramoeba flamelloides]
MFPFWTKHEEEKLFLSLGRNRFNSVSSLHRIAQEIGTKNIAQIASHLYGNKNKKKNTKKGNDREQDQTDKQKVKEIEEGEGDEDFYHSFKFPKYQYKSRLSITESTKSQEKEEEKQSLFYQKLEIDLNEYKKQMYSVFDKQKKEIFVKENISSLLSVDCQFDDLFWAKLYKILKNRMRQLIHTSAIFAQQRIINSCTNTAQLAIKNSITIKQSDIYTSQQFLLDKQIEKGNKVSLSSARFDESENNNKNENYNLEIGEESDRGGLNQLFMTENDDDLISENENANSQEKEMEIEKENEKEKEKEKGISLEEKEKEIFLEEKEKEKEISLEEKEIKNGKNDFQKRKRKRKEKVKKTKPKIKKKKKKKEKKNQTTKKKKNRKTTKKKEKGKRKRKDRMTKKKKRMN